jgi:hypothetical protein
MQTYCDRALSWRTAARPNSHKKLLMRCINGHGKTLHRKKFIINCKTLLQKSCNATLMDWLFFISMGGLHVLFRIKNYDPLKVLKKKT